MCESTCDTLTSSAANQGDNTVSVAQGSTATPDANKDEDNSLKTLNAFSMFPCTFLFVYTNNMNIVVRFQQFLKLLIYPNVCTYL